MQTLQAQTQPVTYRQWLPRKYRRFRFGMQTLPHLESELLGELKMLTPGLEGPHKDGGPSSPI